MFVVQTVEVQGQVRRNESQCAICGKTVRVSPTKFTDSDVICKACRCVHCSIPLSAKPCRCGVAHGKVSRVPGLCERCYAMNHGAVKEAPSAEMHEVESEDMYESSMLPEFPTIIVTAHA